MSFRVGQRLSYAGERCTVRYVGSVAGTQGEWLGVEWDDVTRGKHAGIHSGVQYFECGSDQPTAGSFVRPSRPHDKTVNAIQAVRQKYASGLSEDQPTSIRISGKTIEEVGFDKIQQQMSNLAELQIVVLDGLCVHGHDADDHNSTAPSFAAICPKTKELDLGRNLFEDVADLLGVCGGLEKLEALKMDGNRFSSVTSLPMSMLRAAPFSTLKSLSLEDTLLKWDQIESICFNFPSLTSLSLAGNVLETIPANALLPTSIITLNLERNRLATLKDVPLAKTLPALRHLNLKHNRIRAIAYQHDGEQDAFPVTLEELDLSHNSITDWSIVDALPRLFPGLKSLRLAHNEIYDSEDAFTTTVARLGQLDTLNYSTITQKERLNAETFYLSQIARELSAAPNSQHKNVLEHHPRYTALCKLYGAPNIQKPITDDNTLASRLVTCTFTINDSVSKQCSKPHTANGNLELRLPKSLTVYNVLGLLGTKLGFRVPMQLALSLANTEESLTPRTRTLGTWIESRDAEIVVDLVIP